MKKPTFAATVAAATTMLLLATPLAASAHVHVTPGSATPGSYATLTFTVPTESSTAGTVKLVVDLPTTTPFTSVNYRPIPGWTTSVDTETLANPVKTDDGTITEAPVRVVWTADEGTQIAPGQFQEFTISAGAVPDTGSILLPAHQHYSDGSIVSWTEKTPADGTEPEHPAPTLFVNDAPPVEGTNPEIPSVIASSAPASTSAGTTATAVSIGLGVGALALGALALVVSVLALARQGKVRA